MRIILVGGPRCGKSTFARQLSEDLELPVYCGDPRSRVKEPEYGVTYLPEGLDWHESSQYVADVWFSRPDPWVCEGQIMARALRKWLKASQAESVADQIIVFRDHHPHAIVSKEQRAMHKSVMTVWTEIAHNFTEITEYEAP